MDVKKAIELAARVRQFIGVIARMETDGEIQDRTDGAECMSGDDAAGTLSQLIAEARTLLGSID